MYILSVGLDSRERKSKVIFSILQIYFLVNKLINRSLLRIYIFAENSTYNNHNLIYSQRS